MLSVVVVVLLNVGMRAVGDEVVVAGLTDYVVFVFVSEMDVMAFELLVVLLVVMVLMVVVVLVMVVMVLVVVVVVTFARAREKLSEKARRGGAQW
jgi:hypothetical protein